MDAWWEEYKAAFHRQEDWQALSDLKASRDKLQMWILQERITSEEDIMHELKGLPPVQCVQTYQIFEEWLLVSWPHLKEEVSKDEHHTFLEILENFLLTVQRHFSTPGHFQLLYDEWKEEFQTCLGHQDYQALSYLKVIKGMLQPWLSQKKVPAQFYAWQVLKKLRPLKCCHDWRTLEELLLCLEEPAQQTWLDTFYKDHWWLHYRRRVPNKEVVRKLVSFYRHYTDCNGKVCMDKSKLKWEVHDLRHKLGWPMVARIQLMRIHDEVELWERRRVEERIG